MTLAIGILSGCDKVALLSPTGSTITLTVNKTSVPINGTAEVLAAVIEASGTPVHNGTVVTFTSSFGIIEPREALTEGGTARVTFTGTQSGTAKIGAFSGGAKVATELEIRVGGAAAETLRVRAEPPTIPQAGGSAQIIVTVADLSGNPLPNAPVVFTTDNGSLSPGSTTTDGNGEARTTLTTTRTSKVTAAVAAKFGDVTVTLVNAPTVTVTGPATATAGLPTNFTINPTVPTGGAPLRDVVVNWGDGSSTQNLGPITSSTTVSHAFARADSYTVTATATDQTGQQGTGSFSVNVTRSLPTIGISCPSTAQAGVPASFTVTPPTSPTFPVQNVTVDFTDGTSRNLGQITGPTSFTKTFATDGGFTATATVTDTSGQRGTSSCSVIVGRSQPTVTVAGTTAPFQVNQQEGFTVTATPGSATQGPAIQSVTVTRQDTGEVVYSRDGSGAFVYTFTAVGTYVFNARVTDVSGSVGTSSLVVQVVP